MEWCSNILLLYHSPRGSQLHHNLTNSCHRAVCCVDEDSSGINIEGGQEWVNQ